MSIEESTVEAAGGDNGEAQAKEGGLDAGTGTDTGSGEGQPGGQTILGGGPVPGAENGGGGGDKQPDDTGGDGADEAAKAWTLEAPEGMDAAVAKEIESGCKELGMSREQAVKVLDMRKQELAAWDRQVSAWQNEIRDDPEFGGAKLQESVVKAQRALAAFDPDGKVKAMLESTGYGNNPDVIRLFARAGAAMAEDKFVAGGGKGGVEKSLADRMYADMEI